MERFFPPSSTKEAERVAWGDVERILNTPEAMLQEPPEPDDNHAVFIKVLTEARDKYKVLQPRDQQDPLVLQAFEARILFHQQYADAQAQQAQQQQAMLGAAQQGAEMPGQAAGDTMGALMGGDVGAV